MDDAEILELMDERGGFKNGNPIKYKRIESMAKSLVERTG